MNSSTYAFFEPNSAILVAAVRCDASEKPLDVAVSLGIDLSHLECRGSVQLSDSPMSPQQEYFDRIAKEIESISKDRKYNIPEPNDWWRASDHRWRDAEIVRINDIVATEAKKRVSLPIECEPTWVWLIDKGYIIRQPPIKTS
jgi:hypothetical protein